VTESIDRPSPVSGPAGLPPVADRDDARARVRQDPRRSGRGRRDSASPERAPDPEANERDPDDPRGSQLDVLV